MTPKQRTPLLSSYFFFCRPVFLVFAYLLSFVFCFCFFDTACLFYITLVTTWSNAGEGGAY
jgi:hypothetical protein